MKKKAEEDKKQNLAKEEEHKAIYEMTTNRKINMPKTVNCPGNFRSAKEMATTSSRTAIAHLSARRVDLQCSTAVHSG